MDLDIWNIHRQLFLPFPSLRAAITRNWTQDTGIHDDGLRVKAGMTHAGVAVLGTYVDVVINKQS